MFNLIWVCILVNLVLTKTKVFLNPGLKSFVIRAKRTKETARQNRIYDSFFQILYSYRINIKHKMLFE